MTEGDLQDRLDDGPPLLLDGPTGTELERRGVDTSGPLWSTRAVLDAPDPLAKVHRDHAEAGAEVLTAATFRAHRMAFEAAGLGADDWRRTVQRAIMSARTAAGLAGGTRWVAGSLAPVADCYDPAAVPADDVLVSAHRQQAEALAKGGADLILVETMNTVREAQIAATAAQRTGLPVFVSLVTIDGGRLLSGEPVQAAVETVAETADALLVNCTTLEAVTDALPALRRAGIPWGAYANAATTVPRPGVPPTGTVDIVDFVAAARVWAVEGARIIGSCCGTTPAYTQALRTMRDDMFPG